jgi:hypothetical protein
VAVGVAVLLRDSDRVGVELRETVRDRLLEALTDREEERVSLVVADNDDVALTLGVPLTLAVREAERDALRERETLRETDGEAVLERVTLDVTDLLRERDTVTVAGTLRETEREAVRERDSDAVSLREGETDGETRVGETESEAVRELVEDAATLADAVAERLPLGVSLSLGDSEREAVSDTEVEAATLKEPIVEGVTEAEAVFEGLTLCVALAVGDSDNVEL